MRVARTLHVSVRTIQRRRAPAGTSFRDLTDATRCGLAEGYLLDPGVSIAEVSLLLGFSDQTSFTRAFRRWNGSSPGAWRRARGFPVTSPGSSMSPVSLPSNGGTPG